MEDLASAYRLPTLFSSDVFRHIRHGMAIITICLLPACAGGGDGGGAAAPAAGATGTISGKVLSAKTNDAISGAAVTVGTSTATSQSDGSFTLSSPVGDRILVRGDAAGFSETFALTRVTAGQTAQVGLRMLPVTVVQPVTVSTGATVTDPDSPASITIPTNGLVPESGDPATAP